MPQKLIKMHQQNDVCPSACKIKFLYFPLITDKKFNYVMQNWLRPNIIYECSSLFLCRKTAITITKYTHSVISDSSNPVTLHTVSRYRLYTVSQHLLPRCWSSAGQRIGQPPAWALTLGQENECRPVVTSVASVTSSLTPSPRTVLLLLFFFFSGVARCCRNEGWHPAGPLSS